MIRKEIKTTGVKPFRYVVLTIDEFVNLTKTLDRYSILINDNQMESQLITSINSITVNENKLIINHHDEDTQLVFTDNCKYIMISQQDYELWNKIRYISVIVCDDNEKAIGCFFIQNGD